MSVLAEADQCTCQAEANAKSVAPAGYLLGEAERRGRLELRQDFRLHEGGFAVSALPG